MEDIIDPNVFVGEDTGVQVATTTRAASLRRIDKR